MTERTVSEEMFEVTCCHNIKLTPEQATEFAMRSQAEDEVFSASNEWHAPMMAIDYLYLWEDLRILTRIRGAIRLLYKKGTQGINY